MRNTLFPQESPQTAQFDTVSLQTTRFTQSSLALRTCAGVSFTLYEWQSHYHITVGIGQRLVTQIRRHPHYLPHGQRCYRNQNHLFVGTALAMLEDRGVDSFVRPTVLSSRYKD